MDKHYIPLQLRRDFHKVLMNLGELFQSKVPRTIELNVNNLYMTNSLKSSVAISKQSLSST